MMKFVFCLCFIRLEGDSYVHYKAMLISFSLHLILLMFELLACDRLTSGRPLWVIVFVPLIFGSVASVGACVWSVKHDRSFELELFMAVNALQFVFLPLKLDDLVTWSWEVVFVPLWIVLCLSLVGEYFNIKCCVWIRLIFLFFVFFFFEILQKVFCIVWYFVEFYYEHRKYHMLNDVQQSIQQLEIRWLLFPYWYIKYY